MNFETRRSLERGLSDSAYKHYKEIALQRKPSVLLYVVESYGRRIWDRRDTRNPHDAPLKSLEQRLISSGIHVASAFGDESVTI